MHPSVLIRTSGRDFDGFICDYVFMFFPPSFLRSWGGAVTRIRKSSQRRTEGSKVETTWTRLPLSVALAFGPRRTP